MATKNRSSKNMIYSSNTESDLNNEFEFDQKPNDNSKRKNRGFELNTPISSYQDKRSVTNSPNKKKQSEAVMQTKVRIWQTYRYKNKALILEHNRLILDDFVEPSSGPFNMCASTPERKDYKRTKNQVVFYLKELSLNSDKK